MREVFKNDVCDECEADNVTVYGIGDEGYGAVMAVCAPCLRNMTVCESCHTNRPAEGLFPEEFEPLCYACLQVKRDAERVLMEDDDTIDWSGMAKDYRESDNFSEPSY